MFEGIDSYTAIKKLRFLLFLKEGSYAHQGWIDLFKSTVKYCNIIR